MTEDFGYCEGCGKRITRDDFGFGDAVRQGEKVYCNKCAQKAGADTGFSPAPRPSAAVRPPSTRTQGPAHSSRRRERRRSSVRLIPTAAKPSDSSAVLPPQCRTAQVQKLAASVICPHCFEKLVVRIASFPITHTCEVCGKLMRITAPGAGS